MKRIPTWVLVAGAVAIGALIWLARKRKQQLEQESQQETAGEAPVVEASEAEGYPYSIGGMAGGGSGAGAIGNALESQAELSEIFKSEQSFLSEAERQRTEAQKQQQQEFSQLTQQLSQTVAAGRQNGTLAQGSGGGAPEETRRGVTVMPKPAVVCGSGVYAGWPNGTPPNCWRVSRTKTGGGCECHAHYGSQTLECQRGKAPHCVW